MSRHLAASVLTALWLTGQSVPASISAPSGGSFYGLTPQLALSPNGRQVVFVAGLDNQPIMLWIRDLGGDSRPLPGTELPSYPFWSADGRSVAFFSGGKLKTIPAAGGPVATVCDAPNGRGGTWNAAGVILYASGIGDPIRRVSAAGGLPGAVTTVDTARENSHRFPQFFPDGRHFLFWAGAGRAPAELKIGALDSRETVAFAPADTNAAVGGRTVFYGSRGVLMAQAFDPVTLLKTGDPVRVVEPLSGDAGSSFASVSATPNDMVAFVRGTARPFVLTWFDRAGRKLGTVGAPGQYTNVALSPDGKEIAVSLTAGSPPNRDVWILDAGAGQPRRMTTDPAVDATPVWSADGQDVLFSSQRAGPYQMYRTRTGSSDALVRPSTVPTIATDWCRNGRMLFTQGAAATGMEIWATAEPPSTGASALPLGAGDKDNGVCSPDSRWLAYQSNASGRDEIQVTALERPVGSPVRVSIAGGTQPLWRADGQELFYLAPDGAIMASAIHAASGRLEFDPARTLFSGPLSLVIRRSYATAADGQRFLIPTIDNSNPPVITVDAWPRR